MVDTKKSTPHIFPNKVAAFRNLKKNMSDDVFELVDFISYLLNLKHAVNSHRHIINEVDNFRICFHLP